MKGKLLQCMLLRSILFPHDSDCYHLKGHGNDRHNFGFLCIILLQRTKIESQLFVYRLNLYLFFNPFNVPAGQCSTTMNDILPKRSLQSHEQSFKLHWMDSCCGEHTRSCRLSVETIFRAVISAINDGESRLLLLFIFSNDQDPKSLRTNERCGWL